MECYIHPALDYLNVRTFIYLIGLSHTDHIICDSFVSFSSFLPFLFCSLHYLLVKFRRNIFHRISPSLPACPLHLLFLLSMSISLSIYLSTSLSPSLSVCMCTYLFISPTLTHSISHLFSLSLYFSLLLCFSIFPSLFLSLLQVSRIVAAQRAFIYMRLKERSQ